MIHELEIYRSAPILVALSATLRAHPQAEPASLFSRKILSGQTRYRFRLGLAVKTENPGRLANRYPLDMARSSNAAIHIH